MLNDIWHPIHKDISMFEIRMNHVDVNKNTYERVLSVTQTQRFMKHTHIVDCRTHERKHTHTHVCAIASHAFMRASIYILFYAFCTTIFEAILIARALMYGDWSHLFNVYRRRSKTSQQIRVSIWSTHTLANTDADYLRFSNGITSVDTGRQSALIGNIVDFARYGDHLTLHLCFRSIFGYCILVVVCCLRVIYIYIKLFGRSRCAVCCASLTL